MSPSCFQKARNGPTARRKRPAIPTPVLASVIRPSLARRWGLSDGSVPPALPARPTPARSVFPHLAKRCWTGVACCNRVSLSSSHGPRMDTWALDTTASLSVQRSSPDQR
ncbi:hypothetical protein VTK73DRAFT_4502 [Phialemonium thermophilum]|uniref:Uncharacterized protein n=1 Tax=Phialemonium thermophilum TaxID=223376 RepID=A0ABR3V862_9PEZI